jgi:hypothetical protein
MGRINWGIGYGRGCESRRWKVGMIVVVVNPGLKVVVRALVV